MWVIVVFNLSDYLSWLTETLYLNIRVSGHSKRLDYFKVLKLPNFL